MTMATTTTPFDAPAPAPSAQSALSTLGSQTGIESCRVQFILREFAEFFAAADVLDCGNVELLERIHRRFFLEGAPIPTIRRELTRPRFRVIAVTSGKGGVGKTTVAVNLALSLVSQGLRTLLFDADLGMANVHVYAGVTPRVTLLDVIQRQVSLAQAVLEGPGGLHVLCGASGVSRLADLDSRTIENFGHELRALPFDTIVLDTGAGISAQVIQFLAMADEIVVVVTPNLAATLDGYGVIKAAREARLPAEPRILVNHVQDQAQAESVYARVSGCAQRFLGFAPVFLGALRRDDAFDISSHTRVPLVLSQPQSENARLFSALAIRLSGRTEPASMPALSAA
jgi:flagellar biosynthesis protein FlhG